MIYSELIVFIIYLFAMLGIGIYFFARTKDQGDKSYFLGGRAMGKWVAALSTGASDMSSWVLMGLPASIMATGLGATWIGIGLAIGTVFSWILLSVRLRCFTIQAGDSITIPQYLTNRFLSKSKILQIICAVIFLVAYAIYSAASIKACGVLFNTVIGIDQTVAMYIAAAIIIVYTFLGGFNAVCWTDFIQGMLMLIALMVTPIVALIVMQATGAVSSADIPSNFMNFLPSGKFDWGSVSQIISGFGWGLGYFGMPHIIIRYMSIKSNKETRRSAVIGSVWTCLILLFSCIVGIVGRYFLGALDDTSLVFILMVRKIFPGVVSGILLSAILAAAMSTADSQLLAAASAFTSDVYRPIIHKNASDKEISWVSRFVVIAVSIVALLIAANPGSGTIMGLVENAWGAFGAAFGPAIILSLYWKRTTFKGVVAGISVGFIVDILWYVFLSGTGIYEIVPGFITGLIAAVVVSLLDKKPSDEVLASFEKAVEASKE